MFQKINQRRLVVALSATFVLAAGVYAQDREVVGLIGSSAVLAGENFSGQVSTNETGMSVTFTSDPPGLVNYTAIVPGNGSSVSIPTNPNATGTLYRIVATPSSGGVSKTSGPIAVTPNL